MPRAWQVFHGGRSLRRSSPCPIVRPGVHDQRVGGWAFLWLVWGARPQHLCRDGGRLIPLAGAAELGAVMLVYLKGCIFEAPGRRRARNGRELARCYPGGSRAASATQSDDRGGLIGGLLPVLICRGTGSEVMTRIAAPVVGGMVTAPLLSMLVNPAAWYLLRCSKGRYDEAVHRCSMG